MKRILIALVTCLICLRAVPAQHVALPPGSIALSSPEGQELLLSSTAKVSYWPLAMRHETELGLSHCGPATAVMVLNALGLEAPTTLTHPPFKMFEQDNFFTPETDKILPEAKLKRQGATLEELGAMIGTHGARVEVHHAEDGGLAEFRESVRHATSTQGEFVVVNFLRAPLAQQGGGHFSPIAAYNEKTDHILVMDVARYKYPPWWVPTEALFRSLNTVDKTAEKTRGYLVVRAKF